MIFFLNKPLHALFILFLLTFFPITPLLAEEKNETATLKVIGTSLCNDMGTMAAREKAISKGLITAVELVTADLIPFSSFGFNFAALNKLLTEHADKFINKYKVLTEFTFENEYKVMIQATVSIPRVRHELKIAGIIPMDNNFPSVLFLVSETKKNGKAICWWEKPFTPVSLAGEAGLADIMRKKGFQIITHNLQPHLFNEKDLLLHPCMEDKLAIQIGSSLNAEIIVIGEAMGFKTESIAKKNINSFKGTVSVRAIKTDSGKLMGRVSQTAESTNTDEETGIKEALKKAGLLAGEKLASQIAAIKQDKTDVSSKIEIMVQGTNNLINFVLFRKGLQTLQDISLMQIKQIKSDEATIAVNFAGNAKKLADALSIKPFNSFSINIVEISENFLKIALISKQVSADLQ